MKVIRFPLTSEQVKALQPLLGIAGEEAKKGNKGVIIAQLGHVIVGDEETLTAAFIPNEYAKRIAEAMHDAGTMAAPVEEVQP